MPLFVFDRHPFLDTYFLTNLFVNKKNVENFQKPWGIYNPTTHDYVWEEQGPLHRLPSSGQSASERFSSAIWKGSACWWMEVVGVGDSWQTRWQPGKNWKFLFLLWLDSRLLQLGKVLAVFLCLIWKVSMPSSKMVLPTVWAGRPGRRFRRFPRHPLRLPRPKRARNMKWWVERIRCTGWVGQWWCWCFSSLEFAPVFFFESFTTLTLEGLEISLVT